MQAKFLDHNPLLFEITQINSSKIQFPLWLWIFVKAMQKVLELNFWRLLKMPPNKEEEIKLKEFNDDSPFKLGPAEKFLKAVLDIPFALKRAACEELRNSRLFLKLLEAVLKTGNRMNVGTNRGDAHAFKLDTLLKLADVKGTDGKTSLLRFVVQEITRAEGSRFSTSKTQADTLQNDLKFKKLGLKVVAGLGVIFSVVLSTYIERGKNIFAE